MNGDKVLIDTSVWISYFGNNSPQLSEQVDDLMSKAEICVPRTVIAELIHGSRSEREMATIESFVDAFTIVDQTETTWNKAGRLAYSLKKKGKNVSLTDCYIAVIAHEQDCKVYTLGEHFKDIQRMIKISLV